MKFSIVTITYNSQKTVKETFESVLLQKIRPLEYIVIDGGSIDNTVNIIKEFQETFENAGIDFFWISEKDEGISDAFNKGIKKASGDIIGIINSDDKLCEDSLEKIKSVYDSEIGVYYGDCIIFNDSSLDEFIATPKFQNDNRLLEKRMCLFHPSTFISKITYDEFGLYDTHIKFCMDRDLLLHIYKKGVRFKYINFPLACYREGGTNQVNYDKCAKENMNISIKYGMHPLRARLNKVYFGVHDRVWKLVQFLELEGLFHKKK